MGCAATIKARIKARIMARAVTCACGMLAVVAPLSGCLKAKQGSTESMENAEDARAGAEGATPERAFAPGLARRAYLQALEGNETLLREAFWLPTLSQLSAKLTFVGRDSAAAKAAVEPAYAAVVTLKKSSTFSAAAFHDTIAFAVCALERARGNGSRGDLDRCEASPGKTPETVDAFPRFAPLAKRHPRVIVLPTFANLSLADFDEVAGLPIVFAGLTLEPSQEIDGKTMSPRVFFDHDLVHGQRWADESTNLFPTVEGLPEPSFRARLAQRLSERDTFLRILAQLKARLLRENPIASFVRKVLAGSRPASAEGGAPLSPVQRLEAFDFYVFHELRIERETEAGLVPCLESCWSIPATYRMVADELSRATLTTRVGRPLALLGFKTEREAQETLSQIEGELTKHRNAFPAHNARPEDPASVLGRFR